MHMGKRDEIKIVDDFISIEVKCGKMEKSTLKNIDVMIKFRLYIYDLLRDNPDIKSGHTLKTYYVKNQLLHRFKVDSRSRRN